MRSILTAFLLAMCLACSHAKPKQITRTPIEHQHYATHRIGLKATFTEIDEVGPNAHCSATAIGPHALLTAQHCYTNSNQLTVDRSGDTTTILTAIPDGADHIIFIVDTTFEEFVPLVQRDLVKDETVHMWGNPGYESDIFRVGKFVEKSFDDDQKLTLEKFILPIFAGDSGSGIFDENGNVIAVISLGDKSAREYDLSLQFTPDQLDLARR